MLNSIFSQFWIGSYICAIGFVLVDPSACSVSIMIPPVFESSKKLVSSCTLYHDKGPEPWLRKTSTDAWLSTGMGEAIDGADGITHDQGDIYCVVCYESGALEIFDVPNFSSVFSVDKFVSGKTHIIDTLFHDPANNHVKPTKKESEDVIHDRNENSHSIKVVELAMQRWESQHSRPFLFGVLSDGTILCYHGYVYEVSESASKVEDVSSQSMDLSGVNASRLRNLRFVRVPLDTYAKEETSSETSSQRITFFKNVGGLQGLFFSGSCPAWFMMFRERLRIHPQVSISANQSKFLYKSNKYTLKPWCYLLNTHS